MKPSNKVVVGIDPGVSGAIAVITKARHVLYLERMPWHPVGQGKHPRKEVSAAELFGVLKRWEEHEPILILEWPQVLPKWGAQTGHSLGFAKATVKTLGVVLGYRILTPSPQIWKKAMAVPTSSTMAGRKAAARSIVSDLYPGVVLPSDRNENLAEALLLAEYGLRLHARGEA